MADELDAAREKLARDASRVVRGPGSDRFQEPAIQLNAVLAVPLVRDITHDGRAQRSSRHNIDETSRQCFQRLSRSTLIL